jgi:phosphoglycolate phosphatase-like HAD superfamily hydrolase
MPDTTPDLEKFKPLRKFFIGIDSDGCAFDTMEIKHKECFCPSAISHFGLQAVSKYARETFEFVNLYSKERGKNRFPALISVLDLLRERPEVKARNVRVPDLKRLRQWIREETKLGNPALKKLAKETNDPELRLVLAWSNDVNARIADMVHGVPPFPFVRECLAKARPKADLMVVSQTPAAALLHEWQEHGLDKFIRVIAGQELGTKAQHLSLAARGKYSPDNILMIGDACGDFAAAAENSALFFPILPGKEEQSWKRLFDEGLDRFFNNTFRGAYENALKREFEAALPEKPSWRLAPDSNGLI